MIKKSDSVISYKRFINENIATEYKNKSDFLKKAKFELIGESIKCLEKAKSTHDILESYYIAAMDFGKVSKTTDELINEIFNVSRET